MTESRQLLPGSGVGRAVGRGVRGGITKSQQETLTGCVHVNYFACSDGSQVYICQSLTSCTLEKTQFMSI